MNLKKTFIHKKLLNKISWFINQSVEKLVILLILLYLLFLRSIYKRSLTLDEADNEQSISVNELEGVNRSAIEKKKSKQRKITCWCIIKGS